MYDTNNIFAKILRGEIPSSFVYEDNYVVAFKDIHPKASVHLLVVPRSPYTDYNDFMTHAKHDEVVGVSKAIQAVAAQENLIDAGYQIMVNVGPGAGQEVPHLHFHILSNKE